MRQSLPAARELALVTGASGGIGRAAALGLAKKGYKLILWGRNTEELSETSARCEALRHGSVRKCISYDLLNVEGVAGIINETALEIGASPGSLFHCAGVAPRGFVVDVPIKISLEVIVINTGALLALCAALLPAMRASSGGHITAITSGHSLLGIAGFSAYSAAKAGMERILQAVKEEEGHRGIVVTKISPGLVRTNLSESQKVYSKSMRLREEAATCSPQDVAEAILKSIETKRDITLGWKNNLAPVAAFLSPRWVRKVHSRS